MKTISRKSSYMFFVEPGSDAGEVVCENCADEVRTRGVLGIRDIKEFQVRDGDASFCPGSEMLAKSPQL